MPPANFNPFSLTQQKTLQSAADGFSGKTHFTSDECLALLSIVQRIGSQGKIDRLRFREILHTTLNFTDDIMLDLIFSAFDRNKDGIISHEEWVTGLSQMLRGTPDELIEYAYYVFDMNGDRSLAREELSHCLKGCIIPGYGVDPDEIDECERDIVELCMKKLDVDRDGQITFPDFAAAVKMDPLLLQACGKCIPAPNEIAAFLALVSENYRDYSPSWGGFWDAAALKARESTVGATESAKEMPKKTSLRSVTVVEPGSKSKTRRDSWKRKKSIFEGGLDAKGSRKSLA